MTGLLYTDTELDAARFLATEPGCAFCPRNGKVEIVCDVGSMYLVRAKDEKMTDLPDRWLIIPAEHVETLEDLPLGWGETLVELAHEANMSSGFNLSLNFGTEAGQTMPHLHWWLLDRTTDDIGKGMSWMISEINRLYGLTRRQSAELDRLRQVASD